ncbi:hypothetical protein Vadar_011334 [Vaccinium darrowii]|uniref:Uncharacterized protein n=1 Tax=Vaccinium darrowii TaxID=229202 RepID=A0ACB7YD85_9ERIC|nr:hypothetical protein Vadar_011334 [Vaccinium darrowii]
MFAKARSCSVSTGMGWLSTALNWFLLIPNLVRILNPLRGVWRNARNLNSLQELKLVILFDWVLNRPEAEESEFSNENLDMGGILKRLDVNSLVEDAVSSKVLGKNSGYHGVGLWLLPSFINHARNPNAWIFEVVKEGLKRKGGGGREMVEMERAMKLSRGVYEKVMKKQAMRTLLELCTQE